MSFRYRDTGIVFIDELAGAHVVIDLFFLREIRITVISARNDISIFIGRIHQLIALREQALQVDGIIGPGIHHRVVRQGRLRAVQASHARPCHRRLAIAVMDQFHDILGILRHVFLIIRVVFV